MAVLWQCYLGIAIGTLMLIGFLIVKVPILLVFVAGIWLFYATLRCPECKTFIKRPTESVELSSDDVPQVWAGSNEALGRKAGWPNA